MATKKTAKTTAKKATKKVAKKAVKKTTVKKATPKPKKKGEFTVVVETGGEVYTAQTDDISEALLGFGIEHTNTKINFKVTKGKKTREVTHFKQRGMRILKNGMASRFFARTTEKFLA